MHAGLQDSVLARIRVAPLQTLARRRRRGPTTGPQSSADVGVRGRMLSYAAERGRWEPGESDTAGERRGSADTADLGRRYAACCRTAVGRASGGYQAATTGRHRSAVATLLWPTAPPAVAAVPH